MRKALVAANVEPVNIMEVTARILDSSKLKDLEILRAPSKERALEHLAYGDMLFTVLEDELKGAEAVAKSAKAIDSKLILIDSLVGKVEKLKFYKPSYIVQKPTSYAELSKIVKLIYGATQ